MFQLRSAQFNMTKTKNLKLSTSSRREDGSAVQKKKPNLYGWVSLLDAATPDLRQQIVA